MNDDTLASRWDEMRGRLKLRWSRITDDDLARIDGRSRLLAGVLQHRYGLGRKQAEQDGQIFLDTCDFGAGAPARD